jgi:hypothetical protein
MIGAGSALMVAGAGVAAWRLSLGSMADYAAYSDGLRAALVPPDLADVIR